MLLCSWFHVALSPLGLVLHGSQRCNKLCVSLRVLCIILSQRKEPSSASAPLAFCTLLTPCRSTLSSAWCSRYKSSPVPPAPLLPGQSGCWLKPWELPQALLGRRVETQFLRWRSLFLAEKIVKELSQLGCTMR